MGRDGSPGGPLRRLRTEGTASRTFAHREPSLERPPPVATVFPMPPYFPTEGSPAEGRPGPQVVRLIDRIKKLVAEQQRLDDDGEDRRRDANRREIARLKWRLANAVKRELSPGPGLRLAVAARL